MQRGGERAAQSPQLPPPEGEGTQDGAERCPPAADLGTRAHFGGGSSSSAASAAALGGRPCRSWRGRARGHGRWHRRWRGRGQGRRCGRRRGRRRACRCWGRWRCGGGRRRGRGGGRRRRRRGRGHRRWRWRGGRGHNAPRRPKRTRLHALPHPPLLAHFPRELRREQGRGARAGHSGRTAHAEACTPAAVRGALLRLVAPGRAVRARAALRPIAVPPRRARLAAPQSRPTASVVPLAARAVAVRRVAPAPAVAPGRTRAVAIGRGGAAAAVPACGTRAVALGGGGAAFAVAAGGAGARAACGARGTQTVSPRGAGQARDRIGGREAARRAGEALQPSVRNLTVLPGGAARGGRRRGRSRRGGRRRRHRRRRRRKRRGWRGERCRRHRRVGRGRRWRRRLLVAARRCTLRGAPHHAAEARCRAVRVRVLGWGALGAHGAPHRSRETATGAVGARRPPAVREATDDARAIALARRAAACAVPTGWARAVAPGLTGAAVAVAPWWAQASAVSRLRAAIAEAPRGARSITLGRGGATEAEAASRAADTLASHREAPWPAHALAVRRNRIMAHANAHLLLPRLRVRAFAREEGRSRRVHGFRPLVLV